MQKKSNIFISRISFLLLLFILAINLVGCTSLEEKATKASALVDEEEYDEAIKLYNEILEKEPNDSNTYLELVKIYRILDERELERQVLEDGIEMVEDKLSLQFALADFYIDDVDYENGEKILLEILENNKTNRRAYEALLDIYNNNQQNEKIMDIYKDKMDVINSKRATIFAINSAMNMGDIEQAKVWLNSIDVDKINEPQALESLTETYLRLGDKDNAILAANRGMDSGNPSLFHGYVFGLTNERLNLISMEKCDVNGDGIDENIILMADGGQGNYSEIIELFIQNSTNGEIIDVISLSDIFTGYVSGVSLTDINNDGILDILGSIHSGGSSGMQVHYGYSFKDNNKVNLLEGFNYSTDFMFMDGFKAEVFSDELEKSFMVEFDKERRDMYIEIGCYGENGIMLERDYGYFNGDVLEAVYVESLNQYGLKHSTYVVGPASNSDTVATVETVYIMKDQKWTAYELNVLSNDDSKVNSVPYNADRHESIITKDLKRLDKYFEMTIDEVISEYGEPKETGFLDGGEYFAYDDIAFFRAPFSEDENKVSALAFLQGAKIFGLEMFPNKQDIIDVLGDDGLIEGEFDSLYYSIGGYELYFSPSIDGLYSVIIK
ncbi:hypothetical protein [Sedimentibacter sp. MB31-C6]|uniref:hypothetical protein n=1 Tax=Sedimentibacter sp. MB31-C6 TaxID=3109366 RepID=UPI002DDCA690|nr:hypothetical protein [Sedimentibacter sp. MB36-C1]WSI03633.1 hypothetical protein U8307_11300 [Sedimentibacter sp. MB36-C1]